MGELMIANYNHDGYKYHIIYEKHHDALGSTYEIKGLEYSEDGKWHYLRASRPAELKAIEAVLGEDAPSDEVLHLLDTGEDIDMGDK